MRNPVAELLQALDEELPGLDALLATLRQQRDLLVARDVSAIIENLQGQEAFVGRIKAQQKRRRAAMRAAARALKIDAEATLQQISDRLDSDLAEMVRDRRTQLRQRVELVQKLNGDNQRLIRHALDAVQKMAAAVSGSTVSQPVYEQTGLIRAQNQIRALVDQIT